MMMTTAATTTRIMNELQTEHVQLDGMSCTTMAQRLCSLLTAAVVAKRQSSTRSYVSGAHRLWEQVCVIRLQ